MSKLLNFYRLNKLDVHISPTTLESLETPHLDSAKQRWHRDARLGETPRLDWRAESSEPQWI